MKHNKGLIVLTILSMTFFTQTYAEGNNQHQTPEITPSAERKTAIAKKLSGPTKNIGIASISLLGTLGLANDFPKMQGQQIRAREIVIDPGGVVAVHEHESRPGVAYILEGEIIEYRNDQPTPILRKTGALSFETSGVAHWWENKSNAQVRALIIDIVPKE